MKKIGNTTTLGLAVITIITISTIAFFLGKTVKENTLLKKEAKITTETIIDKITEQNFTVSKTIFLDQEVRIAIKENSDWSDLLWKNVVIAEGMIRTDLGVDFSKLTKEDIDLNKTDKTITILLPEAEILDGSLFGELEIKTETGLIAAIAKLFEENTDDFNLAVEVLIEQADAVIKEDAELLEEARESSLSYIQFVLDGTGYTVKLEE